MYYILSVVKSTGVRVFLGEQNGLITWVTDHESAYSFNAVQDALNFAAVEVPKGSELAKHVTIMHFCVVHIEFVADAYVRHLD